MTGKERTIPSKDLAPNGGEVVESIQWAYASYHKSLRFNVHAVKRKMLFGQGVHGIV